MSKYRKIDLHVWADEDFQALSHPQPCGQFLWFFLLTGPFTGPIPGLFRAGRAAMAEELGWRQEAFDEAFREVLSKGLAEASWEDKLVWLPNALKYNKPESPNVVLSWASELDILPECPLLRKAIESMRETVYSLDSKGLGYKEAFDKTFGKAIVKTSRKLSSKTMPNQEQEQEQDIYNINIEPPAAQAPKIEPFAVAVPPKTDPLYGIIKAAFEKVNGDFTDYAKEGAAIKRIIKLTKGDQAAIEMMIKTFFNLRRKNDKYWSSMPFTPSRLASSGVWDGVKEEAKKTLSASDTSWIDALEKEGATV